MKSWMVSLAVLCLASVSSGNAAPTLIFSGYIDYPARHDYRIEVSTYPSGIISRIATFSGEMQKLSEELTLTESGGRVLGIDRFQQNIMRLNIASGGNAISIAIENQDIISKKKTEAKKSVQIRQGKDILFEDEDKRAVLLSTGEFRIESKSDKEDIIVVRGNQIFNDGWYKSDWSREGGKTVVKEYTTMEIPGDWISDGGGVFSGNGICALDPVVNIINYYILQAYTERPIFIPFIFGLKTGSN
jgi:hypothetical protein